MSELESVEKTGLISVGGPLFRKPGTTHSAFSENWHHHALIASPWFLNFGIVEYVQIHLPEFGSSDGVGGVTGENDEATRLLRQADGVAVVRCKLIETSDGNHQVFGDGGAHPYFTGSILPDERRFLHEESGAGAIVKQIPEFAVPQLQVDQWRELALQLGGEEHVKIQDGKALVEGLHWDAWEQTAGR